MRKVIVRAPVRADLAGVGISEQSLRSHEERRTDGSVLREALVRLVHQLRDSEVDDLHHFAAVHSVQEDVVRFHVAVDHSRGMKKWEARLASTHDGEEARLLESLQ